MHSEAASSVAGPNQVDEDVLDLWGQTYKGVVQNIASRRHSQKEGLTTVYI